ncbi:MAG TPA: dihydrofolate reductase family protein [Streptosporangiaceae bacterium]|jgi:dihydrofolate reductase|nr:dihydrofolate reductase family protein [Streptosporangiaceae bacterium]
MRSLVLHVYDYSLDGVIAEEDSEFYKYCRDAPDDPVYDAWLADAYQDASLHLVGRATYLGMAEFFPTATGLIADAMNRIPKVVFSRTLQTADWPETTIARGDLAEEIDKLRRGGTGVMLAHGGVSFVQSLTRLDLVDEYRLTVYPYVAGTGPRLFTELAQAYPLELRSSVTLDDGTVALTYRRAR